MSLINEALRKAQKKQTTSPGEKPDLKFRPAESAPAIPRATVLVIGTILIILALAVFSGLLLWVILQAQPISTPVAARTVHPPRHPYSVPAPKTKHPTETRSTATDSASSNRISTPSVSTATAATNLVAITNTPPPPLKLQGIFFSPKNPSALVNGQTVQLGDFVHDLRVIAISPVAVMLANTKQTNVLSLSR